MQENFQMPPLFFILCAMSAMAFVVSSYIWLWRVYRGEKPKRDFISSVWMAQFPAFLFSAVVSLCVGLYDYIYAGIRPSIFGECLILCAMFALLFFIPVASVDTFGKRIRFVLSRLFHVLSFGFLCLIGWGVTVGVGFFLSMVLRIIFVMNIDDFQVMAFFVTGLMWIAPIVLLYREILKSPDRLPFLDKFGIRNYLWPMLAAYFILLVPFLIQNIANSKEWHEMKNKKPIKTAEFIFHGHDFKEMLSLSKAPV